jgi:hypothetical protein
VDRVDISHHGGAAIWPFEKPALVVADGGSPIAMSRDGHLYYLCGFSRTKPTDPGGPLIGRVSQEGKMTFASPP